MKCKSLKAGCPTIHTLFTIEVLNILGTTLYIFVFFRLIAVTSGIGANSTVVKYSYQGSSSQPAAVITSSGAIYKLNQIQRNGDKSAAGSPGGELRNVVTPRGHIHSFRVKPAAGMLRFQYQAPWNTGMPYQLHYDASGKILAVIMPSRYSLC